MNRRRSERKIIRLKAERISGDTTRAVFIENISEHGIYVITAPAADPTDYTPGKNLVLQLQLSSGETLNLHCRVIWSYKTPPDGLTDSVGMEVIDPPLKYKEFLKTLH